MEAPKEFTANGKASGKLQGLAIMAAVGVAFTMSVLVMLGHFTRPDVDASVAAAAKVVNPFADGVMATDLEKNFETSLDTSLDTSLNTSIEDNQGNEELCQVMATTIEDINERMSEGVTEQQARYFRSRRNKLYQMMRERCGV